MASYMARAAVFGKAAWTKEGLLRVRFGAALLVVAVAVVIATAMRRPPVPTGDHAGAPGPIRVALAAPGALGAPWRLTVKTPTPRARLDLGPSLAGRRQAAWTPLTPGVAIGTNVDRDVLTASTPTTVWEVAVAAVPLEGVKDYTPIRPFGADGALVYTGAFHPFAADRRRAEARFSVTPGAGRAVFAFGGVEDAIADWRSPGNHPAFLLVADAEFLRGAGAEIVVAPETPAWLAAAARRQWETISARYDAAFGPAAPPRADVFVSYRPGGAAGRLSYAGDALPGQIQITFSGGAWASSSPENERLLARALAHEGAHLRQMAVRPVGPGVPAWIHEGAAEAVAAEALVATGLWSAADRAAVQAEARAACRRRADDVPLNAVERAGDAGPAYDCGRLAFDALARATGRSATDLWRAFAAAVADDDGYDEAALFRFVEGAGDADFAAALRTFATARYARPEKAVAQLDAAATKARAAALERAAGD
ncbi:MAG: hypothetical protein AAGC56_01665 [Pseudomonadota bacterium]